MVVARTLSDDAGSYRLLAPRSGTYRLSARRIGYSPLASAAFALREGETRDQSLSVDGIVVSLDTVRVRRDRSVCSRAGADDAQVTAIWEQARTALIATDVTLAGRAMSATLLSFRRTVFPDGQRTLHSMSLTDVDSVAAPWSSAGLQEIQRSGYVVSANDSTAFRAPGLDVLASDAFAAANCYRVVPSGDSARVALSFEPAKSKRGISELRGTITMDRATSALRSLEFRYTNLKKVLDDAGAGGRMEFAALRDGSWTITRWSIRMPLLTRVALAGGRAVRILDAVAQTEIGGGDLIVARRGSDTLWARVIPPVRGTVSDSASGTVIAGARLRLRDTDHSATTNAAGRFEFTRLMPGDYTLLVNTPSLDSLGAVSAVPLLVSDSVATLTVRVPTAARVMPAVCRIPADSVVTRRNLGVLRGVVMLGDSVAGASTTAAAVNVVVQWKDIAGVPTILRTRADDLGRYLFCNMPFNTALDVRAEASDLTSSAVSVQIAISAPFAQVPLQLERPAPNEVIVSGVVLDSLERPLDGVSVEIPLLSLRATTDARGVFRIAHVPAGAQLLTVRRLGFAPLDKPLSLPPGVVTNFRLVLSTVRTIAGVTTTATMAWTKDFDERRKLGLGQFLTRDQLAKQDAVRLSAMLSALRGTRVVPVGQTGARVTSSRGQRSITGGQCYSQIYLDDKPIYMGRAGEPVPNINEFLTSQLEAVEWYAGPSETPGKYSSLNSGCGVLVLHTRQNEQ